MVMTKYMQATNGIYRHYKGGLYVVENTGRHTERDEVLVIYRDMDEQVYARPWDVFFGKVKTEDGEIPRFEQVGSVVHHAMRAKEVIDEVMNPAAPQRPKTFLEKCLGWLK